MKLAEYLDKDKLRHHINTGLVMERFHDTLPLSIYCYGRKAVFDSVWDGVTTKTRGLIVGPEGEIVARPFEKFFAYDTAGQTATHPEIVKHVDADFGPPVITEKVNGCLGTFWKYGIHWGIASKGSFHSPHAVFATKWMERHIESHGKLVFPEGYTPVFEIICQEVQPHVIKYEHDGLVLLNFINNETGEELDRSNTVLYAQKNTLQRTRWTALSLDEALKEDNSSYEGYVATYNIPGQVPLKLKIKFPTFLKNRKLFYEELKRKESPRNDTKYAEIFVAASNLLRDSFVSCTRRGEFAEFFLKNNPELAPACFAMMDERDHKSVIWKLVERHDKGEEG